MMYIASLNRGGFTYICVVFRPVYTNVITNNKYKFKWKSIEIEDIIMLW